MQRRISILPRVPRCKPVERKALASLLRTGETGRDEAGRPIRAGTVRRSLVLRASSAGTEGLALRTEGPMESLFAAVAPEATLFTDGGSRGNPGPAASGAVLVGLDGEILHEVGHYLGTATNNVAEWTAVEIGLQAALEHGVRRLAVRMDSELVV